MASAVESDDDGESNRDLGSGYGDDEEDKDLAIVVGKSVVNVKSGESDQSQAGGGEHELERHEDDDDVASDDDTREANREEEAGDEEEFVERSHGWENEQMDDWEEGRNELGLGRSFFGGTFRENNDPDGGDQKQGSHDLEGEIVAIENRVSDEVGVGKFRSFFVREAFIDR